MLVENMIHFLKYQVSLVDMSTIIHYMQKYNLHSSEWDLGFINSFRYSISHFSRRFWLINRSEKTYLTLSNILDTKYVAYIYIIQRYAQ